MMLSEQDLNKTRKPTKLRHRVLQKKEIHMKIPHEDNEKQEGGIIPTILGKFLIAHKLLKEKAKSIPMCISTLKIQLIEKIM